jgi:hypothetical protein
MRKTPALAVPLKAAAPPSMQHYYGQFFQSRGGSPSAVPADEYDRTLLAEAGRLSCHGHLELYGGAASDAAGRGTAARSVPATAERTGRSRRVAQGAAARPSSGEGEGLDGPEGAAPAWAALARFL